VHFPKMLRRTPWLVAVAALALVAASAVAYAATQQGPAIVTSIPKTEDQITNIDVLRQQIKNYYGVPFATTGPAGTWQQGFSDDSNYATEARKVAADGGHWLDAKANAASTPAKKAIILDVDDTTLATFNYELYSNWDFNPTTNGDFVNGERFPAVPGMVALANAAQAEGYAIVYLTGRPQAQEPHTLGNLTKVGYPTPTALSDGSDGLFTKPSVGSYPAYLQGPCADEIAAAKSCSTIHYKSGTRAYVESLGYDIVANFGDQFSDLIGGSADRTFKVPNPSYYLP
jgi:predicted secreted acid phosphatase